MWLGQRLASCCLKLGTEEEKKKKYKVIRKLNEDVEVIRIGYTEVCMLYLIKEFKDFSNISLPMSKAEKQVGWGPSSFICRLS